MSMISVIVPVYNIENYLERCINSILSQTFQDFEIILIDDGSSDNSGTICDHYAKIDNRIVVIHQTNGGLSNARNRGIEYSLSQSTSQWLSFIDGDDWINNTYLEGLYESCINYNSKISVCEFIKTENDNIKSQIKDDCSFKMSTIKLYNEYFYSAQTACCKLFHKDLFLNTKFRFPEGVLYEDSAIIYKILLSQYEISYTNKSIYYYFQRLGSITNSEWNSNKMIYCKIQGEQLEWLISQGYEECIRTCLCHYLSSISYQENMIRHDLRYKKYAKEMRKICRHMLFKYGMKYKICISEYPQVFQTAFPNLSNFYWLIKPIFFSK